MTKEYDNTNKGALFVNDKKETEKHPDWKGSINVGGVDCWLSGWKKFTKKGEMVSLSIQLKETKPKPSQNPHQDDDTSSDESPPW